MEKGRNRRKNSKRNSAFELLRLVLMFMIVGYHMLNNSALSAAHPIFSSTANYYLSHLLDSFFSPAVDCFIIISGFFQIRLNVKKIVKIVIMLWGYGIGMYLVLAMFGYYPLTPFLLLRHNFPTVMWFLQYYILLMLASPFLNLIIHTISKQQFQFLLAGMGIFFGFFPTFFFLSLSGGDRGFGLFNFIFMYFIGAYLSLHAGKKKHRALFWPALFLLSIFFIYAGNFLMIHVLKTDFGCLSHFYAYDCVFVISAAISLFMIFKHIHFHSSLVNFWATGTLGVYVIHEQPLLNQILYMKILNLPGVYNRQYFILIILADTFIVFAGALVIELLRIKLFDRVENRLIAYIASTGFIKNIFNKISH